MDLRAHSRTVLSLKRRRRRFVPSTLMDSSSPFREFEFFLASPSWTKMRFLDQSRSNRTRFRHMKLSMPRNRSASGRKGPAARLTTPLDQRTIGSDHHYLSGSMINLVYPARVGARAFFLR